MVFLLGLFSCNGVCVRLCSVLCQCPLTIQLVVLHVMSSMSVIRCTSLFFSIHRASLVFVGVLTNCRGEDVFAEPLIVVHLCLHDEYGYASILALVA